MKASLTFAIAALCALAALPARAGLHEDMVALDRAYIPALALTNQPKPDASKRAMERLRTQWNAFRTTYASAPAGYAPDAWVAADLKVEAAVTAAEKSLAAGKNLDAHEDLEHVREAQYALRRGANVPYFMDDLTAFHSAMEKLVGAIAGKTPATLSDDDLAAVRRAYAAADRAWQVVLANRTRAAQHGVAGEKLAAVQAQIDVETRTLAELGAALAAGDRAKVIEKSIATKPAFSKLFSMFGDFASVAGT
jgi:hypothetical protein